MSARLGDDLAELQRANAELQRRLDEALAERDEALEQQTATAEVLQIINSSSGDLAPVFHAMLDKAMRLCEAAFGDLYTFDGDRFSTAAVRGAPAAYVEARRRTPPDPNAPGTVSARILQTKRPVHVLDINAEEAHRAGLPSRRVVSEFGVRTILAVPLLRNQAVVGFIMVYRQEVRAFTDKQIALLQNFAAQAVIAMENARLITETREALEQQTATAEVLGVINSSPGDLAPVFDAILEKAHTFCGAVHGSLQLYEGENLRAVATQGVSTPFAEVLRQGYPAADSPASRELIVGSRFIHILDCTQVDHPVFRSAAELAGIRTVLFVPLRKDDAFLGLISAARLEVRPFTERQIALVENFAAQAVIAMENARLITETREALQQQTATAEVLGVINSSPGDLTPVFEAILEKAHTLCGAAHGSLTVYDGELFHAVATHGQSETFTSVLRRPHPASPVHQRLQAGERFVQIADMKTLTVSPSDIVTPAAVEAGIRTQLFVPLRKDGLLLGYITAHRHEVRPFSEKEIALLENFAAQAVIAIENARLITETREALEQQTATAEVLGVINSSPGDLTPVFDAILAKALRLCDAAFGHLLTFDGEQFDTAAVHGEPRLVEHLRQRGPFRVEPDDSLLGRIVGAAVDVGQIADVLETNTYRTSDHFRAMVDIGGYRSLLNVALRKESVLFGVILIFRKEARPFSDKQIALLQNFAAQAVIAMENARLITETREALEQQTATADILGVISGSPTDVQPTFDAIASRANVLCDATSDGVFRFDGSRIHLVAHNGWTPAEFEAIRHTFPLPPGRGSVTARAILTRQVVHVHDIAADPEYAATSIARSGLRTVLSVPMLRDGQPIGAITVDRREVRPFSEGEIGLLKTFAAQAVIAIENVRLFDELRQRQAELRVTFDNMGDGVVMFDEELRLAAWNRNFQEMLDLPDEVLVERPTYADYLRILAERGEFGAENIEAELIRRLEHTDQELRLERTRPDGHVIEVRRNSVPDGGFVLIYSDITERKRSEAEIRAARDAAEAAYRDLKAAQANLVQAEKMASLGQLTAGIAHEIKNPLNFVNNFAGLSVELLEELKETTAPAVGALGDDKRAEIDDTMDMLTSNLEKIAEHGRRADGIVKSMLEHSRGGTGERRSVDLNGLVEEALNLAYHGGRAQDQSFNITLERDFDADLAPIELVPQDITRVCLNLFGNGFYAATKREREGGDPKFKPTLKVSTQDLGDVVEIRTRDNGIGISAEIKDKLFQPFFTTKPTGEGTGLGLSISYDIVTQQHGGTIEVDSRVGEFTEFTVRLPRKATTSGAAA